MTSLQSIKDTFPSAMYWLKFKYSWFLQDLGSQFSFFDTYCYSLLFSVSYRPEIVKKLGPLATREQVGLEMQLRPECVNTSSSFEMCISRPSGFKIMHSLLHVREVNQSISAMTASELFRYAPPDSLFGANPNDNLSEPSVFVPQVSPDSMLIRPSSSSLTKSLLFYGTVDASSALAFSPPSNNTFVLTTMLFESVILNSVVVSVNLPPGKVTLQAYVTPQQAAMADPYSAPMYRTICGSDLGATEHIWNVDLMAFGRQMKTVSVGNLPPVFHFKLVGGSSTTIASVRISLNVSLSGDAVNYAMPIVTKTLSIANTPASSLNSGSAPTALTFA
jgi:hypothetical protein